MTLPSTGAAAALRDRRAAVVERWLTGYARSLLRVPRPVDLRELATMADAIADALATALAEPFAPGAPGLREAEKRIAFAGGALGMTGASAFDVTAYVVSLRDALVAEAGSDDERSALGALGDWFAALALEGYTKSREDALRAHFRDTIERGTPVVLIGPELPAAFLIGESERAPLEAAFGRLLLSIVRVGARAAIVDAAGLLRAGDPPVLDALAAFAGHRKVKGQVQLVACGVPSEHEAAWRDAAGAGLLTCERFEDAVERALAVSGQRIRNG